MHTYQGRSATFFFDGGLADGDLIITTSKENGEHEISIDANDVINLVAYKFVKDELIGRIEDMDAKDLLTLAVNMKTKIVSAFASC
jgi:hypothetical protein